MLDILKQKIKTGFKNKKVLLTTLSSPFLDNQYVFPYLGILYLVSVADGIGMRAKYINPREGGLSEYDLGTFDIFFTDVINPSEMERYKHFDLVGISCMTPQGKDAYQVRKMLKETPVPSSGYTGYDEIHLKIKGEKKYAINTVDLNTRFVPVARIKPKMGRNMGKEVLMEGRRGRNLWINGLVKDCTANLGKLFRLRGFKHIIQQNCLTHMKWIVSKHVKAFGGLSKQSRKPVPKEWRWLRNRFYKVLDSGTDTEAYIGLEIVRRTVERLQGEKIKELHTSMKQLESWLPKIIAHQRNPDIPKTNNMTEGFHKKYEYYRAFKTQMMTENGAQRVLD